MDGHTSTLEKMVEYWIGMVGVWIDVLGVFIIVAGIAWASWVFLRHQFAETYYDKYRLHIGRSLLLGLEVLVAADIIKTVALVPTFSSLGVLALLILVRTFLGWTLTLEINGHWPWQKKEDKRQE